VGLAKKSLQFIWLVMRRLAFVEFLGGILMVVAKTILWITRGKSEFAAWFMDYIERVFFTDI
jgi:hypothetical protein